MHAHLRLHTQEARGIDDRLAIGIAGRFACDQARARPGLHLRHATLPCVPPPPSLSGNNAGAPQRPTPLRPQHLCHQSGKSHRAVDTRRSLQGLAAALAHATVRNLLRVLPASLEPCIATFEVPEAADAAPLASKSPGAAPSPPPPPPRPPPVLARFAMSQQGFGGMPCVMIELLIPDLTDEATPLWPRSSRAGATLVLQFEAARARRTSARTRV